MKTISLDFNIGMTKRQVKFIDYIIQEIRFKGGKKYSRSSILKVFLEIARNADIDISGVKSEKECEERFLQAIKDQCVIKEE